ncbi:MAG: OmpA family protein [Chitinophagales bacterium]
MKWRFIAVSVLLFSMSSCLVSKKKLDEQQALANKYLNEKKDCNEKLDKANDEISRLNDMLGNLNKEVAELKNKNLTLSERAERLKKAQDDANALYDKMKSQYDDLSKSSSKDKEKLGLQLQDKERELNARAEDLKKLSEQLNEREKRVKELESLIARKDEAVAALKKKISDALKGFTSDELKVTEQNGKVYVSLSDKLLFKTGSFTVDEKGKSAIRKVAEVLNKQADIGVVVEGHTDNKQYANPKGEIKNNWDLSVMRASTVAEIMVNEGKLDPKRITASGRSEFFPLGENETAEGRSKNRRIEIVLSPDLAEIFKILEGANP